MISKGSTGGPGKKNVIVLYAVVGDICVGLRDPECPERILRYPWSLSSKTRPVGLHGVTRVSFF